MARASLASWGLIVSCYIVIASGFASKPCYGHRLVTSNGKPEQATLHLHLSKPQTGRYVPSLYIILITVDELDGLQWLTLFFKKEIFDIGQDVVRYTPLISAVHLDEGEPSRSYSTYEQRTTSRTFYSTYSRAKNTTKDYNNSKQDIAASSITGNDGWRTTARKGCHPSHSHPCRLSPHFSCVLSPSFDICINCTYYHPEATTTSWVYYLYCRYITGFNWVHNMTHCRQRTLFSPSLHCIIIKRCK